MTHLVRLNNDEIEVACDVLWFGLKPGGDGDPDQALLFARLNEIRTGDYGGDAELEIDHGEIPALRRAFELTQASVELDPAEAALFGRLRADT